MPDWLSWDFWAKDSQSLNHLALIIAGAIGIPLLAIRTFAANRSANAALEQAKAANQSAAAAFEQAKTAAKRHDKQTRADQELRITESFAKAGEQLGSDKLETRLVGIYTLERISKEKQSEHNYYWPVMETLTAFVREHAPWPPRQAVINPIVELQSSSAVEESRPAEQADKEAEPASVEIRPPTDIQAILTVLGRRNWTARKQDQAAGRSLNLTKTNLRAAGLVEAHLDGADLRGAHLEGADLRGAHLEGADLRGARLERANFWGARLERANLEEAQLQGALLVGAHLENANLLGAHLENANLQQAQLQGADLGGSHLEGAYLWKAHLEGAYLWKAHLEGAGLVVAHLEGANLRGAHLEGANLRGAHLEGADLRGAHLEGADRVEAVGLMQGQLDVAFGDDRTLLPDGLTRPAHWPAAASEEPDNAE